MHILHACNTNILNFIVVVSWSYLKKMIITLLWMRYFYQKMYKYKTHITLTSNLHHGWVEVILSPEQPEFLAKAGRVETVSDFINLYKKMYCRTIFFFS